MTIRRVLRLLPVVPSILLLLLFLVAPVAWSFYASFTNASLTGKAAQDPQWVGADNYARMFSDDSFPLSAWLTVVFVAASAVVGQNVLGLLIALLMTRSRKVVSSLVGTAVVAAWVLPEIVAAFAAYAYFNRDGTLNQLAGIVGIHGVDWLYSFPLVAIVLANTWRGTAFSMLVYRAALADVPRDISEAALMDGARGLAAAHLYYPASDPEQYHHQPDADYAPDTGRLHPDLGDDGGRSGQRQHHVAGAGIPGGLQVWRHRLRNSRGLGPDLVGHGVRCRRTFGY